MLTKQQALYAQDGSQTLTKQFDCLTTPTHTLRYGLPPSTTANHVGIASSGKSSSKGCGFPHFCREDFPPQHTVMGLCRSLHGIPLSLACVYIAMGGLFPTGCPVWGHHGPHNDPKKLFSSCLVGRQQLLVSTWGSTALSRVVPYREHCSNSTWEWRKAAEDLVRCTLLPERDPLPSVQSAISSKIA